VARSSSSLPLHVCTATSCSSPQSARSRAEGRAWRRRMRLAEGEEEVAVSVSRGAVRLPRWKRDPARLWIEGEVATD
jgi:hypothetical protein